MTANQIQVVTAIAAAAAPSPAPAAHVTISIPITPTARTSVPRVSGGTHCLKPKILAWSLGPTISELSADSPVPVQTARRQTAANARRNHKAGLSRETGFGESFTG
jgi:hypothetical protein